MYDINPHRENAYKLLHDGILALTRVEQAGIRIDLEYTRNMKLRLTRMIDRLEKEFKNTKFYRRWEHTTGKKINIGSNPQLAHYLYDVIGLKTERITETGQYSTDEESLISLNIPELNSLLRIRKLKKVRDTYLDAFEREQVDEYIHPFFNLHLVTTYRSSSDSPNFQNIPKRDEEAMQICRRALYPRPGHQFLEVDFKGIEVGISTCYHKDPTMLRYLRNPASDMHADMARQIFVIDKIDKSLTSHYTLRQAAKNGFVFPEFYGDYYKNCAMNLCGWVKLPQERWRKGQGIELPGRAISDHLIEKGIESYSSFEEHLKKIENDFWEKRFPEYAKWKERWWKIYRRYGYIDLLTGFRCSGIMSKNDVTNYPVQGAAFHCLLWTLIQVDKVMKEEGLDSRIVNQIHDSMLIDLNPTELNHIIRVINGIVREDLPTHWKWIIVPMQVDMEISPVDESWAEKKEMKVKEEFV